MDKVVPVKWREPTQERSRKRVEAILKVASELIAEDGFERLKMREVALRAEVPIGTVYQFFDDRDAILSCLVTRFLKWQDSEISRRFNNIDTIQGWVANIEGTISAFYQKSRNEPAIAEIWRGVHGSKTIRHLDMEASRRHGQQLFNMLRPLVPETVNDAELHMNCLLVCDLTGAAIRTALDLPESVGEHYITEFEKLFRTRLLALIKS